MSNKPVVLSVKKDLADYLDCMVSVLREDVQTAEQLDYTIDNLIEHLDASRIDKSKRKYV